MSRSVFILGAGASREAGAPLMRDFLDVASDLARLGKVDHAKEDFDLVAEGRSALQGTHSKSIGIDLYNMEAVFSAFEMAKMLGGLGNVSAEKIQKFPTAYRRVIAETLERTISFPLQGLRPGPEASYVQLVDFIKLINSETGGASSILTFNYDMALEFACNGGGYSVDYALEGDSGHRNSIKVLKLHGSLNWTECVGCKKIVAWNLPEYLNRYSWHGEGYAYIDLSRKLPQFSHCNNTSSSSAVPYIVPPTWNKSEHHHAIENVWRNAAKELSEAENIFVIGYSLPETDSFFQFLFSLGVTSSQLIRRMWVVDPDPAVESKYRKLLGPAINTRFHFFQNTFSDGISLMSQMVSN